MARVERFEELVAWQKARELAAEVYSLTQEASFRKDFPLADQLRRAAVSFMSNIAEGFERGSATEFRRFLFMAKASCAEVRSQLYVALDAGHMSQDRFKRAMDIATEGGRITGGLISSIERRIQQERYT